MDDDQRKELTPASVYLNLDEARFLHDYLSTTSFPTSTRMGAGSTTTSRTVHAS